MKGRRWCRCVAAVLLTGLCLAGLWQASRAWHARGGAIEAVSAREAARVLGRYEGGGMALYAETHGQSATGDWLIDSPVALTVMRYVGSAEAIMFFGMEAGALPHGKGCAIDRDSAYALFHTTDALGRSVTVDGEAHPVVGVIDIDRPLLLVRAQGDDMLDQLISQDVDPSEVAAALGTSVDRFAVYDEERIALAVLMCAALWSVLASSWLGAIGNRRMRAYARLVVWLALLVVALMLLPARLMPGQFSDFDFFREGWAAWRARAPRIETVRERTMGGQLWRALVPCIMATMMGRKGRYEANH